MSFSLPFIKKVDDNPEKEHSTPLDIKKLQKNEHDKKNDKQKESKEPEQKKVQDSKNKESNAHIATVYKPSISLPKIDKYILITIISVIFCISGLSFWLYVQFFMSP